MIRVKVPATTANMGPGFDCLGMALNLYNEIEVEEIENGLHIEILDKYLKGKIPTDKTNLIYSSMEYIFKATGIYPKGISFRQKSDIPTARGLGSSSACIVAGLIAGNKIVGNPLKDNDILKLAIDIEGHPDNVAPALLGGMVASIKGDNGYIYEKIDVSKNIDFVAVIPDFKLSTKVAREVLPKEISREDAVFNIGRAMLLIRAFEKNEFQNLNELFKDKLHQDYRKKLIPFMDETFEFCLQNGTKGVYLSGAGPTLMTVNQGNNEIMEKLKNFLDSNNLKWKVKSFKCDSLGALNLNQ
jgi:homoserine kinase